MVKRGASSLNLLQTHFTLVLDASSAPPPICPPSNRTCQPTANYPPCRNWKHLSSQLLTNNILKFHCIDHPSIHCVRYPQFTIPTLHTLTPTTVLHTVPYQRLFPDLRMLTRAPFFTTSIFLAFTLQWKWHLYYSSLDWTQRYSINIHLPSKF